MDPLYLVVTIQPDGTVAVTTPVPQAEETSIAAALRVAAAIGGEVVSAAVVEAVTRSATPPPGDLVHPDTFRERLLPAYLRIVGAPADIAAKWDRIIRDYLPPTRATPVNLASPATAGLVGSLAADGLLTRDEATAALAVV